VREALVAAAGGAFISQDERELIQHQQPGGAHASSVAISTASATRVVVASPACSD